MCAGHTYKVPVYPTGVFRIAKQRINWLTVTKGVMREPLKVSGLLLTLSLVLLLAVAQPLRADVTGVILGTVSDATGAPVPSAKVVLRNANTSLTRPTPDPSGNYEFPQLGDVIGDLMTTGAGSKTRRGQFLQT